ncbi:MAG: ABC transporter ATP-binding protein [Candidatus Symbiothrix sp.]|nr:ABC transporter ATP-binding protein [Candidatus Symbiothrix sp.]
MNVSYGETAVLKNFNLDVEAGSIYCLLGTSGCGKSTLLKTICGIIKPKGGEILLKNKPVNPAEQSIGYIPQHYGLLDWLTVKANLFLGAKIRKVPVSKNAENIIEQLELKPLLKRYPKELSGGQQQRVALARAWMLQPELMLMDEPFSSLDTFTAERSRDLFLYLWKAYKTTTLFVTHNIREAVHTGNYIVLLPKQAIETPEIFKNPLFQANADRTPRDFYDLEQTISQRMQETGRDTDE